VNKTHTRPNSRSQHVLDHKLDILICVANGNSDVGMTSLPDPKYFISKTLADGTHVSKIEYDFPEFLEAGQDSPRLRT